MTRTEIKAIIKNATVNKEIKWSVLENTRERIVLTNDYLDNKGTFTITVTGWHDVDENTTSTVVAVDDTMGETCVNLLCVNEWIGTRMEQFNDFRTIEDGFKKAIEHTVNYFDYTY